ncbi:site-specific integrase [Zoogloea sp. LCSB751]|uniref:tyrosine-type recombinase/integrase n=1 Tax=Zoogloea sp. LCSB751 TaxID=1965277 RepID=UPI00111624E2|nr:site-specific integrase [Zoogloea sp. LCSB751]
MTSVFRNVSLVSKIRDGRQSWRLLDANSQVILGFEVFAASINRSPLNTRKNYCRNLAQFFDYMFEAGVQLAKGEPSFKFSRQVLADILESYHSYLTEGMDSGNMIARLVAKTLPPGRNGNKTNGAETSAAKHAVLRRFLELSEKIRAQQEELAALGFHSMPVDNLSILPGIGERRPITDAERRAMLSHSMLAGVISRGPQFIAEKVLPTSFPSIRYDDERAFPIERVPDFLAAFRTHRDKTLYALLAASGVRISEALQLLWEDIDLEKGEVKLIDPKRRPNHPSYLYLTPLQREKLVWKGRNTSTTMLIEPFKTLFFKSLADYHREEYVPHGRHKFLFQYSVGGIDGEPYLLAGHDSYTDVFKGTVRRVGIALPKRTGPHSLRHMYGTYLLNYFPRPDGTYGLPIGLVKAVMGHASVASTEKYARHDKDMIALELKYANQVVFHGLESKSLVQIRLDALQAQVKEIEKQLLLEVRG